MAVSKLKRPAVIDQVYEQKEILSRILGIPRMDPIVRDAVNLNRAKMIDIVGKTLGTI